MWKTLPLTPSRTLSNSSFIKEELKTIDPSEDPIFSDLDCNLCVSPSLLGGLPQRSDADVHSVVTAQTSTALWQRKQAQCCDSSGSDSTEITMYITVTMMATDICYNNVNAAITALSVVTVTSQYCHYH